MSPEARNDLASYGIGSKGGDKANHGKASIKLLSDSIPSDHGAVVVINRFHRWFFGVNVSTVVFFGDYSHFPLGLF